MLVERIKHLCIEKGTTIKQLEISVGISNGVIRKWDTSAPRADLVAKIADYFGVTMEYLLTGKEPKYKQFDLQMFGKDQLVQEAMRLLEQMPPEMKKAAIEQLKALAALNKK